MAKSPFNQSKIFQLSNFVFRIPIPGTESVDVRGNRTWELEDVIARFMLSSSGKAATRNRSHGTSSNVEFYKARLVSPLTLGLLPGQTGQGLVLSRPAVMTIDEVVQSVVSPLLIPQLGETYEVSIAYRVEWS